MEITNPPQFVPYLVTTDNDKIFCKVIEIPAWDMDTAGFKQIAHGLGTNWNKIVGISAFIYNDAGTLKYPITWFSDTADPQLVAGGVSSIDNTNIVMRRRTGGYFDQATFSSTVSPRGDLLCWFKE